MDNNAWWQPELLPTVLPVAMTCALIGTLVLTLFTRWQGVVMLMINFLALFIGAYLANLLLAELDLPLQRLYAKPIALSFLGMSVSAVLLLTFFARHRNS